jgi:hypothetical protein
MTTRTSKVDTFIDHESLVAERYRWWGVYLIREKRRLQGIADAVQAEAAQAIVRSEDEEHDLTAGIESPDALLTRVDAEIALDEAAEQLEADDRRAVPSEPGSSRTVAEVDDTLKRRLSGRAALLRQQTPTDEDEDY